ncbi:MAG: hypothetical protein KJZ84_10100 [Bryobacteraceae bacterium]|nr:hypothetical protein [Bryobacteraceae bacterium]
MKRAASSLALALALAAAAPAQQPFSRSARGVFDREVKGSVSAAGVERLKVISPGRVTLRPSTGAAREIHYAWTHRVRARNEAEANALGDWLRVESSFGNGWCVLNANGADLLRSELTLEVPAGLRQYVIEAASGSVTVRGLKGDVQASTGAGAVDMDEIGGGVTVRTGGGALTFGKIGGALRCLSGGGSIRADQVGGEAVLESAGGEIWVRQAGGAVRASTSGNIHIGNAGGMVSAHTAGGLIEVDSANGVVTAETAGGPIVIGMARGVRADSAHGGIRVGRVTGVIRAATAAGSIFVGLGADRPLEDSFLSSGRGDITVTIPAKVGVSVKALNESGSWYSRIVSDFPEVRMEQAAGRGRPVLAEGPVQGGGAALLLSVGNGTVYLKRAK